MMITASWLEKMYSYDSESGVFTHLSRRSKWAGAGDKAGFLTTNGYVSISVGRNKVLAHRLAWAWMTGKWPSGEIDHINRNRSDNRFCNLREADRSQNSQNGSIRSNNTTGVIGVNYDRRREKFVARVMLNGKAVFQKRFSSFEEACAARAEAAKKFFGAFDPDIARV